MATSCAYGPEEERVVLGQILGVGDSYQALVVTHYERFRRPTGLAAFPDGGKSRVLERRARLYLVDAAAHTASVLTERAAPDSLWESFSLSVRGLIGDTVSYVELTGCPRDGPCYPGLRRSLKLRVSMSGEVQAVAEIPTDARLPGVMLARREGEESAASQQAPAELRAPHCTPDPGRFGRPGTSSFRSESCVAPIARLRARSSS